MIGKSVVEIHEQTEGEHDKHRTKPANYAGALVQIALLDIVFSLDSVITAVGMADDLSVMIAAVVISIIVMMLFAERVSRFVKRHPTLKVLALSFLILIGVMLVAEGIGTHIEKGYIYFQDFIPDNEFDTRLFVIGNRCFGGLRYNRKNDFRASGSDSFHFAPELFDLDFVKLAFDISKKLQTQSLAFDFLQHNNEYRLVEISYCFPANGFNERYGYWDQNLKWHEESYDPTKI